MLTKLIEEIYGGNPEGNIYHYTSVKGLMGIVESKSIWTSDTRYLNDKQELNDFSKFLSKEVESRDEEEEFCTFIKGVSSAWQNHFHYGSTFVCSFSEKGDLLSQWRGYCPSNKGISIGFSSKEIKSNAQNQSNLFGKCIYDNDKKQKLAGRVIDELLTIAKTDGFAKNMIKIVFRKLRFIF